jgi:hypothetical protein
VSTTTSAIQIEVPEALKEYLSEQQDRARELWDILCLLDEHITQDNGALAVCRRMALNLNDALDANSIRKALRAVPPEEPAEEDAS